MAFAAFAAYLDDGRCIAVHAELGWFRAILRTHTIGLWPAGILQKALAMTRRVSDAATQCVSGKMGLKKR